MPSRPRLSERITDFESVDAGQAGPASREPTGNASSTVIRESTHTRGGETELHNLSVRTGRS